MIERRGFMGCKSTRMYVLCLAALAVMIAPVFQQMYTIPETTEVEEKPNNEHFFSEADSSQGSPQSNFIINNTHYLGEHIESFVSSEDGHRMALITHLCKLYFIENNVFKFHFSLVEPDCYYLDFRFLKISNNGEIFAFAGWNKVYLFSFDMNEPVWISNESNYLDGERITGFDISDDGTNFAVSTYDKLYSFSINETFEVKREWVFDGGNDPSNTNNEGLDTLAISGDGSYIVASIGVSSSVTYFFSSTNEIPHWVRADDTRVNVLEMSYSGDYIVSGRQNGVGYRGGVEFINSTNGIAIWTYEYGSIHNVAISETGDYVAVGTNAYDNSGGTPEYVVNPSILLFSRYNNTPLLNYTNGYHQSQNNIQNIDISMDERYIIAQSQMNLVSIFEIGNDNPTFSEEIGEGYGCCNGNGISIKSDGSGFSALGGNGNRYLYTYNSVPKYTDAWLTLELLSWQGNSSTTWDTDGTDIDPQFQVCIDLDGDLDGISPRCEWTQIWNNTLALSNAWNTTFDLVEENHLLNISIECWDNDDDTDEWNNGPDACDMNPYDDEWRLYYEVNWSNITTETFSGDGSIGNDTQWGNAESTWKVTVSYYGDEDNDGVFDNADYCLSSSLPLTVDRFGCSWFDDDTDGDGILNVDDPCPSTESIICGTNNNNFILGLNQEQINIFGTMEPLPSLNAIYEFNSPNVDSLYFNQIQMCGDEGYNFVNADFQEMSFSCESFPHRHTKFDISSDNENIVLSYNRDSTDDNLYNPSDELSTSWGNFSYPPAVYGCTEDGFYHNIRDIAISNKGDFVIWSEYYQGCLDENRHIGEDKIWVWYQNSSIINIKSIPHISPWGRIERVDISHDGRYAYVGPYPNIYDGTGYILNLSSYTVELELSCEDYDLAYKSNHIACLSSTQEGKLVEIIDYESNKTTLSFPISSGTILNFSPSDNHLLSYEKDGDEITVMNLETGNTFDFSAPHKPGFDAPRIIYSGFYTHDYSFIGYVQYDWSNKYQQETTNDRHEFFIWGIDSDEDGFIDLHDHCVNIFSTQNSGCPLDSDNDGVYDSQDLCPDTNLGLDIDVNGCALYQLDSDGDGVSDESDECPNTPEGDAVKLNGCLFVDGDGDGIDDTDDLCPNTPSSETVGLTGCSSSQLDTDFDGIYDLLDYCPYTAANSTVDVNGCATDDIIDSDSDGDGIRDSIDQCDSSSGVVVDDSGCQITVSSSTEEIDDGLNDGIWLASCCFGLLFALLMCYFGWHYYDTKQFSWAIILNLVILFIIIISYNSHIAIPIDDDYAFQCPDGTILTYADSVDARADLTLATLEEFLENPPPEWCDESIVWLDDLINQYYAMDLAIIAGIIAIPNAILVYFQKSTSPSRVTLPKRKQSSNLYTPWYKNKNVLLWSFIISAIIFALLPIGPLESNVENIPGSSFVLDFPCDEGENRTECWKYEDGEPKNANEQYRTGLFYLFGSTIVGIIVTAIILSVGDEGIILLGAALFGLATIVLALGWIYATLSLLIAEIFAINILYILNLLIFIASIIGWLDDDPSFINTSRVGIDTNKKPKNRTKPHGKGKIDHEQIKRLVKQYGDNKLVLQNYVHNSLPEPKESSLMNAIRHRRSEYEKELQSKPKSLREQGSVTYLDKDPIPDDDDEWDDDDEIDIGSYIGLVLEDEEVFGTIIEFDDDEGLVTIEEDGTGDLVTGYQDDMFIEDDFKDNKLNKQGKNNIQSAQIKTKIKPVDTDFLNSSKSEKQPTPSKPIITEDSQGVITRRTSFSVVRIDKISQIVEKTPTRDDLNQMFIDEITTMKALDDKNIEVGLIDYELGDAPKIVTRYFGSHKLGDVIATANDRGKKILISELIKKVNKIHGAGWVHRDLKPDNIMVDKRPKGDHRFAEIIDYGIAMKINRRQKEVHNTAGTVFFGHSSQKDTNFNASTGQDWFAMARIIALIIRGTDIDTLDAEINMSMNGLNLEKELTAVGFNDDQVNILQSIISLSTQSNCQENIIIGQLSNFGKQLNNKFQ